MTTDSTKSDLSSDHKDPGVSELGPTVDQDELELVIHHSLTKIFLLHRALLYCKR